MNYKKIYDSLIERGKNRELKGYGEKHHIIPRCLGGLDDKTNLVKLTPEEHYVAHQLLVKIYPENMKLAIAASMMIPNRPNNKLYGWIRKRVSLAKSIEQSGDGNSQYGTRWVHNPNTKQNKKIKGEIESGWIYGKYKQPKKEKHSIREMIKIEQIKIHREYYETYKQFGFIKFVEMTGYNKTQANLVQQFEKLLDNFSPQNGKKR
jgi:hypothetical protein